MSKRVTKPIDIQPVILCGGSGTRLWPLSRQNMPKQFLPLVSNLSMLQDTALAVGGMEGVRPPIFVTNEQFRFMISAQMKKIDVEPTSIILEPEGRNTAPAIALAAFSIADSNPDTCMLVMPSDHVIGQKSMFHSAIRKANEAVQHGHLVTFGMKVTHPETGYGYIRQGSPIDELTDCSNVESFVEKPDLETAESFISQGDYHWNSGMFMFTARRYLEELGRYNHDILTVCNAALAQGENDGVYIQPRPETFAKAENVSIDYAVMEHTRKACVIAADFGWSDVGSWASLADLGEKDKAGNVSCEHTLIKDCKNTIVKSGSGRLVTALGLEDIAIIETSDAVLVAPVDKVQNVKEIVDDLKSQNREEAITPAKVHRPWGTYEGVHHGDMHQVKHIVVNPGERLSAQYHHYRSEHWVIVSGIAEVTVGEDTQTLEENQSVYIPVGETHRLFNPGKRPLHLIEVQCGDYLGEDDIVRLDDIYGRVQTSSTFVAAE